MSVLGRANLISWLYCETASATISQQRLWDTALTTYGSFIYNNAVDIGHFHFQLSVVNNLLYFIK